MSLKPMSIKPMPLKLIIKNQKLFSGPQRQRGFLIPLAIFIVVVMSLFAAALWRTTVQTSLSGAQELVAVQAFYAAESGAQNAMQELFFPDASSRAAIDARCTALSLTPTYTGVAGLGNCSATVSCACVDCTPASLTSFYTITSVGSCGSGLMSAVRRVRVGSFMDER